MMQVELCPIFTSPYLGIPIAASLFDADSHGDERIVVRKREQFVDTFVSWSRRQSGPPIRGCKGAIHAPHFDFSDDFVKYELPAVINLVHFDLAPNVLMVLGLELFQRCRVQVLSVLPNVPIYSRSKLTHQWESLGKFAI